MQLELLSNIDGYQPKGIIREMMYNDCHFSLAFCPLSEDHAALINQAVIESFENLKYFMDWSHRQQSIESQLIRIKQSKENFAAGLEYDFSVFDLKTKEFLMSASLSRSRVPNKKALSVGYWTSSKHSNKGLATLTTKILTILAFEYLDCDRVEIGCNKENQASLKVIKKCSFYFEGESRNYFSQPTIDMIKNGFCPERGCLHYALIKEDISQIHWFEKIKNHLNVTIDSK